MATQKLKINSATENIFLVERFIEEVCEKFHITEEHYGNILIAITEAVNNAIQHGNKSNPNKSIEITLTAEKNKISFTIEDEGNGFDYSNIPDPTNPENIEKPNGRGVFLMRNLADKVCFYDKGKKVELDFNVCAN
ncbi:MAG TPA: ATP-binding protein [Bacteroidia bacterium]|nr:ATP-binding protein [Bacteroidia bacterium]